MTIVEEQTSQAAPAHPSTDKRVVCRDLPIITSSRLRWINRSVYVLVFAALAALLVWIFIMLNTTAALAVAVVGFMVGYMLIMGCLASRSHDQHGNMF